MVLVYLFLAVVMIFIIGMFYQWAATKLDEYKYQAPGQFIQIDGRKLHFQSFGSQKGPVVLFDHGCGIGSSSLIWKLAADKVSEFARVITYDRAGYGWSDPGRFPQTNEAAVEDLRILIEKANIQVPLILVGHSYGGLNVRLFAKKYPQLVAGLVLVDAVHEDELTSRFPSEYVKGQLMGRKAFKMISYLCRLGVLRIAGKLNLFSQVNAIIGRFPPDLQPIYKSTLFLDKTAKAVYSEFANLDTGFELVRDSKLGSIPLVVIKSGIVENVSGFSKEAVEKTEKALHDVAVEMSRLSSKGELWIAAKSGHNVHVEDPDIVIRAIQQVCL